MPDQHASSTSTPYSDEDLEYFRKLLLNEQAETRDEIEELKQSLENQNSMEDERASSQHHHVGNVGSEEQEKERLYLLQFFSFSFIHEIEPLLFLLFGADIANMVMLRGGSLIFHRVLVFKRLFQFFNFISGFSLLI